MIGPGHQVRKKDGTKFFNGQHINTVAHVGEATDEDGVKKPAIWLEESGLHIMLYKVEKVGAEPINPFKQGDRVRYKNGHTFANGALFAVVDRTEGDLVWFTHGTNSNYEMLELVDSRPESEPKPAEEESITLTLSLVEATALCAILHHVGGMSKNRNRTDAVMKALYPHLDTEQLQKYVKEVKGDVSFR